MQYVIVENQQTILLGPMDWRQRMFQSELDDLEIDFQLSPSEPMVYQKITDEVEIYPVGTITVPEVNHTFEHLSGPFWAFNDGLAIGRFDVHTSDLDVIKANLKNEVAAERYRRQNLGTTITIGGAVISVGTDTESLNKYVSLANAISESINYKSDAGFVTLTKENLQSIVDAINTYIQTQFNWELTTDEAIDTATTLEELKEIIIVVPGV